MSEKPVIAARKPIVARYEAGVYWWCACGRSQNQPFCDGSHQGTSFSPVKVELSEEKQIAWCTCKHSKKGAFCDGTHKSLE